LAGSREFYYPSCGGAYQVYARVWTPEEIAPRGVVQIVHGISEHVGRYDHVASFLAERGFVVCGEDHLGHGNTAKSGIPGYFSPENGWKHVVEDIRHLHEVTRNEFPKIPYFMLGHSMGSFLARTYLIDYPGALNGAILSGTGQESAATLAMGRLITAVFCSRRGGAKRNSNMLDNMSTGSYNKKFKPNRTRADWISRDEAVVDAYCKDPFCKISPTVGAYYDLMRGLQYISKEKNMRRMEPKTPIFFLSGAQDPVGACGKGVKKVRQNFEKMECADLTMKLYPEGRHEMFNELNREEVYQDVLNWLERHL
jgi:alpha-beta hydrolase superfamily lysophospholipase